MVDFCDSYERYYREQPTSYLSYAYAVLQSNPTVMHANTLSGAMVSNTALRQALYKSIYQYCYEYKYFTGTKQGVDEVVYLMLYSNFHMNAIPATILTTYIVRHYKQAPPAPTPPSEQEELTTAEPSPKEEEPTKKEYTYVEQMPSLPGGGGMKAIVAAIQRNLRYPAEDKQNKTEGRVLAAFTVDEAGQAGSVKIIQGLSATINAEAVRAIEALPKFTPGKQNGRAVAVSFTVPLHFNLPTSTSLPTTP
jgi:TonB family protein